MTRESNALAQVRRLFAGVDASAVTLAAELLDAVETGRDLLAPIVDEDTPAGHAAGIAFQLLSDAAASAAPPAPIAPALPFPASRNGFASMIDAIARRRGWGLKTPAAAFDRHAHLLADARARGRGQNLDGTPRRECRPLKPATGDTAPCSIKRP